MHNALNGLGPAGNLKFLDAVIQNGVVDSQLGAFQGDRLRLQHMVQSFPEIMHMPETVDHVMVVQTGGALGVERYKNGRLEKKITRLKTTTIAPADQVSAWRVDDQVEVLHFYIDDHVLRGIAEQEFNVDGSTVEILDTTGADDDFMRRLAPVVLSEIQSKSPHSRLMLDSFDTIVACHLLRNYSNIGDRVISSIQTTEADREKHTMAKARAYISERLSESFGMADVARHVGLTEFHFSRCFKKASGVSPHQYLLDRRISKARDLLANSDEPLSGVAYDCGFSSQSHFTSAFGKKMGVTPGEFRMNSKA
ncbi:MAG: AraC family transcriptional regulator [Pseudomonadota bacterium]